jgi:hypothetical protein
VSPEIPDFSPNDILRTLARHHVRFILIGGLAAVLHGSPLNTSDADICPDRERANLEALAAALHEMNARIRSTAEPDGLSFACDAEFLERMKMVNLQTDFGWFDISFEPAGFEGGYAALLPHAVVYDIEGISVHVASLHDVIRSKEAANRDKDRAALPYLYALEDEIAAAEREGRSSG